MEKVHSLRALQSVRGTRTHPDAVTVATFTHNNKTKKHPLDG
jgi:hypothetical protein